MLLVVTMTLMPSSASTTVEGSADAAAVELVWWYPRVRIGISEQETCVCESDRGEGDGGEDETENEKWEKVFHGGIWFGRISTECVLRGGTGCGGKKMLSNRDLRDSIFIGKLRVESLAALATEACEKANDTDEGCGGGLGDDVYSEIGNARIGKVLTTEPCEGNVGAGRNDQAVERI